MGQLVGGDGLELVARALGQETFRDGDGGRAVVLDDGQRVDGEGRQDVGVDAGQAGGDADLVERVEELDVVAVGGVGRRGLEAPEDDAGAVLAGVQEVEDGDDQGRREGAGEKKRGQNAGEPSQPVPDDEAEAGQEGQADDADEDEMEGEDRREERQAPAALALLDLVEISRQSGHGVADIINERSRPGQRIRGDLVFANTEGPGLRRRPRVDGDAKTRSPFAKTCPFPLSGRAKKL